MITNHTQKESHKKKTRKLKNIKMKKELVFSEGDIIIRKEQAEDDNRKWLVTKVFKGTLWVKGIIGDIVIGDFLYKGVRKDKMKIIGHRKDDNHKRQPHLVRP